MLAFALVAFASQLAAEPAWIEGPEPVPGAAPARNPALALGGGRVHAVYRQRAGGLGHMVAGTGDPFTAAAPVPGAEAAASHGDKNYPALAVDEGGAAHLAWAPLSAPGNGARYLRVSPDGAPIGVALEISARWIESLAVGVAADEVHVVATAIKQDGEPDAADGVFDHRAPVGGGAWTEIEAWPYPNLVELALSPTARGGLALIARWDVIKRLDLAQGQWGAFQNVAVPAGMTSVGRPQLAHAAAPNLWAAIGWVDAVPTAVVARAGGPKQPWTTLASGDLFDPDAADGGPAVALALGPDDSRALAWLAADAPRLRLSLGAGDWGAPVALPGTDDATSFALVREGDALRVVFARADGTLMSGRVGLAPPAGETTGGTGEGSSGGSTGQDTGSGDTSSTGTAPTTGAPSGASTHAEGTDSAGVETGTASSDTAAGGAPRGGCGCRGDGSAWSALALLMLGRRGRRLPSARPPRRSPRAATGARGTGPAPGRVAAL